MQIEGEYGAADQGGLMERYYEQIVVLRIRVSEDEQGGTPSKWNWTELLDLARLDGAQVIAASEILGPNKD